MSAISLVFAYHYFWNSPHPSSCKNEKNKGPKMQNRSGMHDLAPREETSIWKPSGRKGGGIRSGQRCLGGGWGAPRAALSLCLMDDETCFRHSPRTYGAHINEHVCVCVNTHMCTQRHTQTHGSTKSFTMLHLVLEAQSTHILSSCLLHPTSVSLKSMTRPLTVCHHTCGWRCVQRHPDFSLWD